MGILGELNWPAPDLESAVQASNKELYMASIATLESHAVEALWDSVSGAVSAASTVQDAADHFLDRIHSELTESLALARVFLTTPFDSLSPFHLEFANGIAGGAGITSDMTADTPILSLLATRGVEAAWNDVKQSQGHVGIPLASEEFVGGIPMLARLLQEFDVGSGLVKGDFSLRGEESAMRSFFVRDAATGQDDQGRDIIPMQDFVADYGVRSVFGIGGPYWENSQHVLVCIFFAKETLERSVLTRLQPLFEHFKEATAPLVQQGHIFA